MSPWKMLETILLQKNLLASMPSQLEAFTSKDDPMQIDKTRFKVFLK